jgi:RNA polymerase sigma-70 factor (ECF subfamily)
VNPRHTSLADAPRRPAKSLDASPAAPRLARGSQRHLDEAALFAALAHGDRDALATLYDRHAKTLFALAMQLAGERARAEDLLHDTFLDLVRHAREPGVDCPPVLRWLVQRLFARGAAPAR